ncbi:MAG TPA: class A beta-lactamase-related serine hydrolase [Gammaproteobacteria bacterium]|nr:class A beta-lactamase-related serine hydrolase [Gammaproteobacteria bacterium]HIL98829.1 class A beta-lactamase-related serine hydrolase [Pseudomonadales bacterium]
MQLAPEKAGFSTSRLNWITDHINRNYVDPQKIAGCQILVSRHGHPAYFQSFGQMDIERNKPMADDAIFRIYSMSKPITSIALMQLYERGYFQLNDPVYRLVPEWRDHRVWVSGEGESMVTRAPETPITFRHILSHSGGLTYGESRHPVDQMYKVHKVNRGKGETLSSFMQKLAKVPLRYDPGQQWLYSLSTDVCGGLVEAISGQPFDEYLKQNIFEPLGMDDTAFYVPEEKQDRLTANYNRNAEKKLELLDDPENSQYLKNPSFFSGGGGLTGTTADYYKFCEMLRRGGELDGERMVGPRTLEMMHMNHLKGGQDLAQMAIGAFSETAYEGVGFGLGFAMTLDQVSAGGTGVGDYYWGGAASTIFWVDPKEDLVAIFMTQLMPSNTFNFRGQLKNIIYGAIA